MCVYVSVCVFQSKFVDLVLIYFVSNKKKLLCMF